MKEKSALGKEIYKGAWIGFLTFGMIIILIMNKLIPYNKINKDFNFLFHPLFLSMVFSNFKTEWLYNKFKENTIKPIPFGFILFCIFFCIIVAVKSAILNM